MRRCCSAAPGSADVERRCGPWDRFGGFGTRVFPGHRRAIVPTSRVPAVRRRSLPFVGHGRTRTHPRSRSRRPRHVGRRVAPSERCRDAARRNAGGARRRTPLVRRQGRQRRARGIRRRVPGEQLGVPRDRRVQADGVRQAAEGVAREGRRPGANAGAGARAGVRRTREPAVAAERAHRDSRDGAPDAARPGTLGRDSAEARRRAGGHAAVLRLRRAGDGLDRRRAAASRSDRPSPGRRRS